MRKKNLWILTEERPKTEVLETILRKFVSDRKFTAFFDKLRVLPILENGKFTFTYKLIGFECNKVNEIFIKTISGSSSFVDQAFAAKIIEQTQKTKPHELLAKVKFEKIKEGACIQMLHLGSYDSEPESFRKMEAFAEEQNLQRQCHTHREIYLSDARKVATEKLKTVLRFRV